MARGVNKVILVDEYARGASIPAVAERHSVSRSTVRMAALQAGVLRTPWKSRARTGPDFQRRPRGSH
jgi:transposase-like protein